MAGEIKFNRRRGDTDFMKGEIVEIEAKTIQRRVYDAINFIESLGIISKQK